MNNRFVIFFFCFWLILPPTSGTYGQSNKSFVFNVLKGVVKQLRASAKKLEKSQEQIDYLTNRNDKTQAIAYAESLMKQLKTESFGAVQDVKSITLNDICPDCKSGSWYLLRECHTRQAETQRIRQSIQGYNEARQKVSGYRSEMASLLEEAQEVYSYCRKNSQRALITAEATKNIPAVWPIYHDLFKLFGDYATIAASVMNKLRREIQLMDYRMPRWKKEQDALNSLLNKSSALPPCESSSTSNLMDIDLESGIGEAAFNDLLNSVSSLLSKTIDSYIPLVKTVDTLNNFNLKNFESLAGRIIKTDERILKTERELEEMNQALILLQEEMEQVLEEMNQGLYCNKCWRSKTQIEDQTGNSFRQHLDDVNGDGVPAPSDKIKEKEEEYLQKIERLKEKIERSELKLEELESKRIELEQEVSNLCGNWNDSFQKRTDRLETKWTAERNKEYEHLNKLDEMLENIDSKIAELMQKSVLLGVGREKQIDIVKEREKLEIKRKTIEKNRIDFSGLVDSNEQIRSEEQEKLQFQYLNQSESIRVILADVGLTVGCNTIAY